MHTVMRRAGTFVWFIGTIEIRVVVAVPVIGRGVSQWAADEPCSGMVEDNVRLEAAHEPGHDQDHREREGLDEAQSSGWPGHEGSVWGQV